RAEGEWAYRLPALSIPDAVDDMSAAAALTYSAVELFVERAMASADTFHLTDEDVGLVVEVCRKLDGMPLAIELAAARMDTFSLRDLAERLDDRFALLTRGRRTAIPRHQALKTTLDWSHDLLSADERAVLRRLSVLRGAFHTQDGATLCAGAAITETAALEHMASLASKSLLSVDASGDHATYRLLETTRAYAG